MFSMKKTTLELAQTLRNEWGRIVCLWWVVLCLLGRLRVFLDVFDVVAVGEGEQTMTELAECIAQGKPLSSVKGLSLPEAANASVNTGPESSSKTSTA